MQWAAFLGDVLGALLAPERCSACDVHIPFNQAFCSLCAATIVRDRPVPAEGSLRVAFGLYGGALAKAIHRFKYEGRADLARPLGSLLAHAMQPLIAQQPDMFVPIPLARAKLVSRGYNQAALLASRASRVLGVPTQLMALERVRNTRVQATLRRRERTENMAEAFAVPHQECLQGKRIVLIDDVMTTGATLVAAAGCIRKIGGLVVGGAVVARTEVF